MAANPYARDPEFRERVKAILSANRELGGRFEDASVDQIIDLMQEGRGRAPKRKAQRVREEPPRIPVWPRALGPIALAVVVFVAIFAALPALGALVSAAIGIATAFGWVVFALAIVVLIRLFRRTMRAIDGPLPWGGGWDRREWRRSWRGGCGRGF